MFCNTTHKIPNSGDSTNIVSFPQFTMWLVFLFPERPDNFHLGAICQCRHPANIHFFAKLI